MKNLNIDLEKLTPFFRKIGLYNPANQFYAKQVRKHQQILAYLPQIMAALNQLSTKRPIVLVDCGCGKSYLSFILYAYCSNVLKRPVKIIGIDRNPELIRQCKATAEALGFSNMHFYAGDLASVHIDEKIDITYSLHACDAATDHCIAKGINLGARYIFSVSCCQHTNRNKIRKHPLTKLTKHGPYKERLVDMINDSLRALLLEHKGYRVKIFEFINTEKTPKNIMLRATINAAKKQDTESAMSHYKKLTKLFNIKLKLEELISI